MELRYDLDLFNSLPERLAEEVYVRFSAGVPMGRWLNIGIILACFGIFVSVSDFLLTKDQKKKIEDFIETVTLRLDYTRTLDWLQRWLKASRRASIAAIFFGVITVIAAIGVVAAVVFVLWGGLPWWAITGISIVALLLWQWQWGYVIKAYETVGEPIIESLANSPSYGSLIGGYLLVIFGGGLVLVICVLLLIGVHYISQNWGFFLRIWLGLAGNFVFGMVICWIEIGRAHV